MRHRPSAKTLILDSEDDGNDNIDAVGVFDYDCVGYSGALKSINNVHKKFLPKTNPSFISHHQQTDDLPSLIGGHTSTVHLRRQGGLPTSSQPVVTKSYPLYGTRSEWSWPSAAKTNTNSHNNSILSGSAGSRLSGNSTRSRGRFTVRSMGQYTFTAATVRGLGGSLANAFNACALALAGVLFATHFTHLQVDADHKLLYDPTRVFPAQLTSELLPALVDKGHWLAGVALGFHITAILLSKVRTSVGSWLIAVVGWSLVILLHLEQNHGPDYLLCRVPVSALLVLVHTGLACLPRHLLILPASHFGNGVRPSPAMRTASSTKMTIKGNSKPKCRWSCLWPSGWFSLSRKPQSSPSSSPRKPSSHFINGNRSTPSTPTTAVNRRAGSVKGMAETPVTTAGHYYWSPRHPQRQQHYHQPSGAVAAAGGGICGGAGGGTALPPVFHNNSVGNGGGGGGGHYLFHAGSARCRIANNDDHDDEWELMLRALHIKSVGGEL